MTKIGLNGLGVMGSGMAGRLLGAGFDLTVYNRNPERAEPLRQAGAKVAATPAEAAEGADFVITMVADDGASREVWLGESGALESAQPGAILIDCSTLSPGWIRELAAQAETKGCPFLDAPVTGSRPQAQNGELLFLVGGSSEALEKARPVLQPMSRGVVHLGANGAGAVLKLINNFLCGVQAASLAEAMVWLERSGLDRDQALQILTGGAPGSPLVKALAERMSKQNYETNFRFELMMKDLAYAHAEASRAGIDLATAAAAVRRFEQGAAAGYGSQDISAVVEALRRAPAR